MLSRAFWHAAPFNLSFRWFITHQTMQHIHSLMLWFIIWVFTFKRFRMQVDNWQCFVIAVSASRCRAEAFPAPCCISGVWSLTAYEKESVSQCLRAWERARTTSHYCVKKVRLRWCVQPNWHKSKKLFQAQYLLSFNWFCWLRSSINVLLISHVAKVLLCELIASAAVWGVCVYACQTVLKHRTHEIRVHVYLRLHVG